MTKPWYKDNYRRNLVDMHIDAWDGEFLSKFDPEQYFTCLQKGRITSPMIYTHSHVGWCNWPSKSGAMHPAFKGENKIKRVFDLCNQAGMDTVAYYSLIYNNWAYDTYPEWRMIDIDGVPSRGISGGSMMGGGGRYGLLCPNNAAYRDFLKKQFAELLSEYECKAVYLDMTFWPMICFCPSCRARYKEETGKAIPEYIDWTDPEWLAFQEARERWMTEFSFFATRELKALKPGVTVEHQSSTAPHPWTFGVRSSAAPASDFTGGDLYGGYEQQSFVCKLYYDITCDQPFEYQTSRCDPGLFDHTTTKSAEMLKLHAYLTYAHHGAFFVIDAIDPRGTMNSKIYDTIGEVFSETMAYEPFFTGELEADVSLYFSYASKLDLRNNKRKRAILGHEGSGETSRHLTCLLGAEKALRNAHIPFRINTDKSLAALDKNKVVILSDLVFVSREEEEALVEFVEQGGSLYMSGITPASLVNRILGLTITGFTAETVTYMRPTAAGQQFFCMYDPANPMTIFDKQVLAGNVGHNRILAAITLPYTDPKDSSKFASIHSNPPGIDTEYPAIAYGSFGKGKAVWSAAPFEQSSQTVHKQVFTNLIQYISSDKPQIKSDAPAQVEFTIFRDQEKKILQLHCVNIQEQFPMIPLGGFSVALRLETSPRRVVLLPATTDVPFTVQNGYVEFRVEDIAIFRMYQIEW
ncbi:hypothetical protein AGMMS4952_13620 [Spirochaetia bacterium]|nr:hypothetical protein AGMMS4952_13620 [Spirochaetia bacterium]